MLFRRLIDRLHSTFQNSGTQPRERAMRTVRRLSIENLEDRRLLSIAAAPRLDAGGPYVIDEGNSLSLNAGNTYDPAGWIADYRWDLNGDGAADITSGQPATSVQWSQLAALGIADDGTYPAGLSVGSSSGDMTFRDRSAFMAIAPSTLSENFDRLPDSQSVPSLFDGLVTFAGTAPTVFDLGGSVGEVSEGTLIPEPRFQGQTLTLQFSAPVFGIGANAMDDFDGSPLANQITLTVTTADHRTFDNPFSVSEDSPTPGDTGFLGAISSSGIIKAEFSINGSGARNLEIDSLVVAPLAFRSREAFLRAAGPSNSETENFDNMQDGQAVSSLFGGLVTFGGATPTVFDLGGSLGEISGGTLIPEPRFQGQPLTLVFPDNAPVFAIGANVMDDFDGTPLANQITLTVTTTDGNTISIAENSTAPGDTGFLGVMFPQGITRAVFSIDGNGARNLEIDSLTVVRNAPERRLAASTTVHVNNVAASNINLVSASSISEDDSVTLGGSFADPGTSDTHTVTIDWGDGSPATRLSLRAGVLTIPATIHRYLDDGPSPGDGRFAYSYPIRVAVDDDDGGSTAGSRIVTVNNSPPIITGMSLDKTDVNEGDSVTLTGSFWDQGTTDKHALQIDWGDGSGLQTLPLTSGGRAFVASHTYLDNPGNGAAYTIRGALSDDDLGSAPLVGSGPSPIINQTNLGAGFNITSALGQTFTPRDTSADTIGFFLIDGQENATIKTNDYSVDVELREGEGAFGRLLATRSYSALSDGFRGFANVYFGDVSLDPRLIYTAVVRNDTSRWVLLSSPNQIDGTIVNGFFKELFYDAGFQVLWGSNALHVTVNDVAPELTISGADTVNEGSTYTLGLASSDPGNDTISRWFIDWGDGSDPDHDGVAGETLSGNASSATHVYVEGPNTFMVQVRGEDEEGVPSALAQVTVAVENVAPVVNLLSDSGPVREGESVVVSGILADRGSLDTQSYAWTVTRDGREYLTGSSAELAFIPDDNGTYVVTLAVTDDDGGVGSDTREISIANVEPTLTLTGTHQSDEGAPYSLTLGPVVDPGQDTVSRYVIHWGDGGSSTINASALPSNRTIRHTYLDGPANHTITVDLVDEDVVRGAFALDASFGFHGSTIIDFPQQVEDSQVIPGRNVGLGVASAPDGSITVFAENYDYSGGGKFVRYTADGNLDTDFGTGGQRAFDYAIWPGGDIAIDSDGRILVGGYVQGDAGYDIAVARYTPNGLLDTTFGDHGKAVIDLGSDEFGGPIAIDGMGRILTAGGTTNTADGLPDTLLIRLTADGTLDESFGSGGHATSGFAGIDGTRGLAVAPNGDVIVFGYYGSDSCFFRFKAEGTLDRAFGTGGRQMIAPAIEPSGDLAIDSDGHILLVGRIYLDKYDFALTRYNADGSLDQSFGTQGVAAIDVGPFHTSGASVAIDGEERLLVSGGAENSEDETADIGLVRLSAPANRYVSVASHGVAVVNVAPTVALIGSDQTDEGAAYALTLGPVVDPGRDTVTKYLIHWGDGGSSTLNAAELAADRTVAHTYVDGPANYTVSVDVVDEDADQSVIGLDTSFGTGGLLTTGFPGDNISSGVIAIPGGGWMLFERDNSGWSFVRYHQSGTLDTGFGFDGRLLFDNAMILPTGHIATDQQGRILVAGSVYAPGGLAFAVARYFVDGTLDASFGNAGVATCDLGGSANAVAVDEQGGILLTGSVYVPSQDSYVMGLVRLNEDGSSDETFGTQGRTLMDLGSGMGGMGLAIGPGGKIIVLAGSTFVRYDSHGILDTSFGTAGIRTVEGPSPIISNSLGFDFDLASDHNGHLLLVGSVRNVVGSNETYSLLVYEYDADGAFVLSFPGPEDLSMQPRALALDDQGGILVTGLSFNATDGSINIGVMRLVDETAAGHPGVGSKEVNVVDVAPTVALTRIDQTDHGPTITLTGTVGDPGVLDTHLGTIAWGDGSAEEIVPVNPQTRSFSASHHYVGAGQFTVVLTADDSDGLKGPPLQQQIVVNRAPRADAGGPYAIAADGNVLLDASRSTDPDAVFGDSIVQFDWDLNGDGRDDVSTALPTYNLSWSALRAFGFTSSELPVRLTVHDSFGLTATANTTLSVPAPTAVYVNDNWATMLPGQHPTGVEDSGASFGYDAFATIQAGIDAVASGGTVFIWGGTYGDPVNLNKPLARLQSVPAEGENRVIIGGAVRIAETAIFTGGGITFGSTVDGDDGSESLTVDAGGADVTFSGKVGGTRPLANLTVYGNEVSLSNVGGMAAGVSENVTVTASTSEGEIGNLIFTGTMYHAGEQVYTVPAGQGIALNVAAFVSYNGSITFNADDLQLDAPTSRIDVGTGSVTIQPSSVGRRISLGASATDDLELTDAELDCISAGILRIGNHLAGPINISQSISPANCGTLRLIAGSTMDQSAPLIVDRLAIEAGGTVTLRSDFNNVQTLAARVAGGSLFYTDADGFAVGTVDGIAGATAPDGGPNFTSLAGDIVVENTAAPHDVLAASNSRINVRLLGNGAKLMVSPGADVSGGSAQFTADRMDLSGTVTALPNSRVILQPATAGWQIDLGSASDSAPNTLELSDEELDRITAGVLWIGSFGAGAGSSGAIAISSPIDLTVINTLRLNSNADVSQTESLSVRNLAIEAGGAVALFSANDVNTLAIHSTAGHVSYLDANGFMVGTVDEVSGIAADNGSVTLSSFGDIVVANTGAAQDVLCGRDFDLNINVASAGGRFALVGGASVSGNRVRINSDRMDLAGSMIAASTVTLQPITDGWMINLGSATDSAPDTLELSDAELDRIAAAILRIGSHGEGVGRSGSMLISSAIDPSVARILRLTSALGGITTAPSGRIVVPQLALDSAGPIILNGFAALPGGGRLYNQVQLLAATASGTDSRAYFENSGALVVGTVDGLTGVTAHGGVTLITHSPLTIDAPVSELGGGNILLVASGDGGNDDNLIVNAPVVTSGGNGSVVLSAGTDLVVTDAGAVSVQGFGTITGTAGGSIEIGSQALVSGAPARFAAASTAIRGTAGDDTILIRPSGKSGEIEVVVNGSRQGVFAPSQRLVVYGGMGDDDIQVAGSISVAVWLFGETGNDRLKGGAGNDVLDGGDGDDTLVGNNGRDFLIGGRGADRLVGNADDDILLAGFVDFGDREAAIDAIMAEWTSSRDYASRVKNIRDGSGSTQRANGSYFLKNGVTAFDDGDVDILTGSAGMDWFLLNDDEDKATDLSAREFEDVIDWIMTEI